MQIFRVEHPSSFDGPFNRYHGFYCGEMRAVFADERRFPTVWSDFNKGGRMSNFVCGVDTMELVRYWFGENAVIKKLCECGYNLTEFDVHPDNVRFGKSRKQVLFIREEAKLSRTQPIQEALRCAKS